MVMLLGNYYKIAYFTGHDEMRVIVSFISFFLQSLVSHLCS